METNESRFSERDLRAIDAVSLGLIGAGTLGLFVMRLGIGPAGVGRQLLLFGAILLCGAALHTGVLQEQRRLRSPVAE